MFSYFIHSSLYCHALALTDLKQDIDFSAFTIMAGYNSAENARKRFSEVKKRAREAVFTGTDTHFGIFHGASAKKARTPAKATGQKRKAAHVDNEETASPTPAPKNRGQAAKGRGNAEATAGGCINVGGGDEHLVAAEDTDTNGAA